MRPKAAARSENERPPSGAPARDPDSESPNQGRPHGMDGQFSAPLQARFIESQPPVAGLFQMADEATTEEIERRARELAHLLLNTPRTPRRKSSLTLDGSLSKATGPNTRRPKRGCF
jgi:hypothetical protein